MSTPNHWICTVRRWWTIFFSLLLLLNLDKFGYAAGLGPAPKYWSAGVFAVTLLFYLPGLKPMRVLSKPLLWWALGYLLVSIIWFSLADNLESAADGLVMVVTTCLYVCAALLAYPSVAQHSRAWGAMLWLALILAVLSIIQEYFNPAAYVFAESGQGIRGRAAGLYLNPNLASQTLVLLLACLMVRGSPRSNIIAVLLSGIGLLLTLSRGGILVWMVLVAVATLQGRLPRWFLAPISIAAATVVLAGPWVFDLLSAVVPAENRISLDRLAWVLDPSRAAVSSPEDRTFLATYAWTQFLEAPLLGHGLGYMWVWGFEQGAHNMSLRFMVEYGVMGTLIFPLLLVAAIRSSTTTGSDRRWVWLMAGIVLLLSLFSHNMTEQAGFILPWLSMCLMAKSEAQYVRQ